MIKLNFRISNLEAYYAYRDKFLDNKDSERTKVTPFSNADITRVATSLDTSDKKTIYGHSKHMLEAGKKTTRTNEFITWAKDSTKKILTNSNWSLLGNWCLKQKLNMMSEFLIDYTQKMTMKKSLLLMIKILM